MAIPEMIYVCPICRVREQKSDKMDRHVIALHGVATWVFFHPLFPTNAGWEDDIDEMASGDGPCATPWRP